MTEWGLDLPSPIVAALVVIFAGVILVVAITLFWGLALWVKKSDFRLGERMGAEHVDVVEWTGHEGYVRAGGELWRATSKDALAPGDKVKVVRADGLVLDVRKK
jgi:membrane-bound ClpP family serine protease